MGVCMGVYDGDIIHVYPELRRPNYLHFTVNLCGRLAHFWRHYVMAADGGSHNGFLCFFSAEACKNLGACHASGRPAYLLVLVYLMVSGKCQPDKEKIVQTFLEVARFEPG